MARLFAWSLVYVQLQIELDQDRLAILHRRVESVLLYRGDNLFVLSRVSALEHTDVGRDAICFYPKTQDDPGVNVR